MPTKTWNVIENELTHVVKLQYGQLFGKRVISVDGRNVLQIRKVFATAERYSFDIGNTQCFLVVQDTDRGLEYDLVVHDISQNTGEQFVDLEKTEWTNIKQKGKVHYLVMEGIGGVFIGILFSIVMYGGEVFTSKLIQFRWIDYFWVLLSSIIAWSIFQILNAKSKWKKYQQKFKGE